MVRVFHIYKDVWNPVVGDILKCQRESGNLHDPYAVTVVRDDAIIVGHIPRRHAVGQGTLGVGQNR